MGNWDGSERRDGESLQSRVRALEIYRENHQETLHNLSRDLRDTNTSLSETNKNLSTVVNKLTEIKTTQRNGYMFAGLISSVFGGVLTVIGEKLFKV